MYDDSDLDATIGPLRFLAVACLASATFIGGLGFFLSQTLEPVGMPTVGVALLVVAALLLLAGTPLLERTIRARGRRDDPARSYSVAATVGLACRESVSVLGLVLAAATGEAQWAIGGGALAVAALVATWPSRDRLAEHVADQRST